MRKAQTAIVTALMAIAAAYGAACAQPSSTTGTGPFVPTGNFGPTPVPPSATLFGSYDDDAPGGFEAINTWLGRTIDFASIHSGQASESDFVNSPGYVIWSSRYSGVNAAGVQGDKLLSVPLIWWGATLQAAASGAYDADYATVANTILASIPAGPIPGQQLIYVRTGWEQNLAGEMPWSSSGQEATYVAAFQRFVTVFRSNDPNGRFRFVWCPNVGGDPIQPSYPGDSFIDVVSMDFYYGLSQPTSAVDPDQAFQEMLDNGLSQVASIAATAGKSLAFSEWGVNQDNFGNYVRDFFDWCRGQGCLYVTYWDNDAGYQSKLSDGSLPETGAMLRHLFNPAGYPVEPIAAPPGVSATAGDGTVTVSGGAVRSSTPVTTYYLYKGFASGMESTVPVATSPTPSFIDVERNGRPAFYRMGAGNALSMGYLSSEVSAIPRAPSKLPLPADWLALASNGWASSATPSLEALMQLQGSLDGATIAALVAPGAGAGFVAGFPNGLWIALDPSHRLVGFSRDYWNNQSFATSTLPVPFAADGTTPEWVRADFDAKGAVTTFYVAQVVGGTTPSLSSSLWSQLGSKANGQNHNGVWDGALEPFYVGGNPGSPASQLLGRIYNTTFWANGILTAQPRFDARAPGTTSFKDSHGKTWTVGGAAVIH